MKSPLCRADRGLSISRPALDCSISMDEDRPNSDISGEGSNGDVCEALEEGLEGVRWS